MDWTKLIKNISIIIASWTAVYGIDQWRREYRGKRQAELAEEVLSLFYEAQDAVRHIRNPFGFGGEGASRKLENKEGQRLFSGLASAFLEATPPVVSRVTLRSS